MREAVAAAESSGVAVSLHITGHTDTVGSDRYNLNLSIRRAVAVKTEMVQDGLAAARIGIEGRGYHDPLVPTGPGVREPQNRRAMIDVAPPVVGKNECYVRLGPAPLYDAVQRAGPPRRCAGTART